VLGAAGRPSSRAARVSSARRTNFRTGGRVGQVGKADRVSLQPPDGLSDFGRRLAPVAGWRDERPSVQRGAQLVVSRPTTIGCQQRGRHRGESVRDAGPRLGCQARPLHVDEPAGVLVPRSLLPFPHHRLGQPGHRIETLRTNGDAWQFRHARIQDHLIDHARAAILRRRADTGDRDAAWQLVWLLRKRGDLDEPIALLRRRADAGDRDAAWQLAQLLRERGDLDELRRRADTASANSTTGQLITSTDKTTWQTRASLALRDFAVSPPVPEHPSPPPRPACNAAPTPEPPGL